jgi:Protein of unknown function (DUF2786)/SprT-like family
MKQPDLDRLTVQYEAALLRELSLTYHDINASHFKRALKMPEIRLSDTKSRLGQWDPDRRVIEISRALVIERPWGLVLEVLKHEMAHQYVHEILGRGTEAAHGPAFREICERLAIDARAAGMPSDAPGGPSEERATRVLERIARLLSLAQSSNAHEAQAAAGAAQRLMLKYNLDAASAGPARGYAFRHLGTPNGRVSEAERLLSTILGEHFFVEVIWIPVYRPLEGKRGQVLEICGTPANLEMASYVHGFLIAAAERLWLEHKRSMNIRSNRDRRTYLAGVMEGFREKLHAEKKKHREQGLVWIGDSDLTHYYRKRHPHVRHTRTAGERRTAAHHHGRAAGRSLVLHRGMHAPASASNGVRALPPRRA